ncbi:PQQ-binding-like beta-propeller repeat protein [Streptomyces sp. NPDC089799]|uniref:outer membrane protein assembly factor BamB family protein n=1 Tax=Streptomyces sp. NPDC089799 TaxID=3155066 RepID=UPI00343777AE
MTNPPPVPEGYGHLPGPPQHGYGAPQQGPNPYASQPQQPQQPPQQPQQPPQFGQPQPPQPPQQPPLPPGQAFPPPVPPGPPTVPPGGGRPGGLPAGRKGIVLIAAATAAVLALGAGGYVLLAGGDDDPKTPQAQGSKSPGSDDKPGGAPAPSGSVDDGDGNGNGGSEETDLNAGRKPGEDKVLWLRNNDIELPGGGAASPAQWVVGDTVVKAVAKSVTAYAVADGKQRWTVSFPAEICGATGQTTADGKTVVAFKNGASDTADCNQMKLIDLKAGKEGWTKEVPKEGLFDIMTKPSLAITGDTLTVSRMGSASAFKVSTGDKLFGKPESGCRPSSYAGGAKLIAIADCGDQTEEIQGVDPVTGKPNWTFKAPKGWTVDKVYGTDPLVAEATNKAEKKRSVLVVGSDGKLRSQLTGEGSFAARCGLSIFSGPQSCTGVVVDGPSNTVYMPTEGDSNEIAAFDLTSGKIKWRAPAGEGRSALPLKAENGQLIAYLEPSYDKGGEVLSFPAGGGKPTTLLRNPSGAATVESGFFEPQIDWAGGRLFISQSRLNGRSDGPEKFLMAFGK